MEWKTIIMSDLHLGARQSQSKKILKFLKENKSEKLILNGDIIDGWAIKYSRKWDKNCTKILKKIVKLSDDGVEIIYIRGNHDDFLKPYIPFKFNKIKFVRAHTHYGLDGRSYFCFHGDMLDLLIIKFKWIGILGSLSYDWVIRFNTFYNIVRKKLGLKPHSLANYVKQNVKGASNFIKNFEVNAEILANQKGCDVAICGHIHKPKISENYMNSGDFCENSTCLVEDFKGQWYIIEII